MSIIDIIFCRDRSFRLGNYKDFFCTAAAQASYLQFCIMMPYINQVISITREFVILVTFYITYVLGDPFCV